MKISVYIRPLTLDDAHTSYLWRNDTQVWTYTNFKSVGYITEEQEKNWLSEKLTHNDEKRFAICVKELDTYIGNVQLLDIKDQHAELHLFIGNKLYWGKGIGYQATLLTAKYGFEQIGLEDIYLKVHPANVPALAIYEKAGFEISGKDEGMIDMHLSRQRFFEINSYNR